MMAVHVRVYGLLRSVIGSSEVNTDLEENTLGGLIDRLAERYGVRVKEELLDENGKLDYSFAIFVKGERQYKLSDRVEDGEEVAIASVISGG